MAQGNPYPWLRNNISSFTESLGPWYENQVTGKGRPFQGQSGQPTPDDIPMSEIMSLADKLYGSDPLSGEEQERLTELSQRQRRLQPMDTDRVYGGGRIRGNLYSIDTRGFATGAANLAKGVVNNIRRNRREDFEGELGGLLSQQQANQQAAEDRGKFIGEMVPEMYKQGQQTYRNRQDNQRMIEQTEKEQTGLNQRNEANQQGKIDLENLRHKNNKELERLENELDSGTKGKEYYSTAFNNLVNLAEPELKLLDERISEYENLINNPGADPDAVARAESVLQNMQSRKNKLLEAVGKAHAAGVDYNKPENVREFINTLKVSDNEISSDPGSELVSPNNQGQQMTPDMIRQIVSEMLNGQQPDTTGTGNQDPDQWFNE